MLKLKGKEIQTDTYKIYRYQISILINKHDLNPLMLFIPWGKFHRAA